MFVISIKQLKKPVKKVELLQVLLDLGKIQFRSSKKTDKKAELSEVL